MDHVTQAVCHEMFVFLRHAIFLVFLSDVFSMSFFSTLSTSAS